MAGPGGFGVLLGVSKTPKASASSAGEDDADVYTEALNDGAAQLKEAIAAGDTTAIADAFRAMHAACNREEGE